MTDPQTVIKQVIAALARDVRVNLHRSPIRVDFSDGLVVLSGEVEDIATKKTAVEIAASLSDVYGVGDRLRVAPAQRKADGDVRDSVSQFLLQESALMTCTVQAKIKDGIERLREASPQGCGEITITVEDGVVHLDGHVCSLEHKRLVGVLAWWVPGSRDVVNGLAVIPEQEGNDDEITDAVRVALEKDPLIRDDAQIRVTTRDGVVSLQGYVPTEEERKMAESDAWYVFGVNRVDNRIETPR
jgi:osmotically-inducible protein OsmY